MNTDESKTLLSYPCSSVAMRFGLTRMRVHHRSVSLYLKSAALPEKPASTPQFVRRIFAAGRFFIAPMVARRAMWHSFAVVAL